MIWLRSPEAIYQDLAKLYGITEQEAANKLHTGQIQLPVDERPLEEQLIETLSYPITTHLI